MTARRGSGSALLDQIRAEHEARQEAWARTKPAIKVDLYPTIKTFIVKEYVPERSLRYPSFEIDLGRLQVSEIVEIVATYYGAYTRDIYSHRRLGDIAFVRHIVFYLSYHLTPLSMPQIARRMGGRDHTTVLHGLRRIEKLIKIDEKLMADIATLIEMLQYDNQTPTDDGSVSIL